MFKKRTLAFLSGKEELHIFLWVYTCGRKKIRLWPLRKGIIDIGKSPNSTEEVSDSYSKESIINIAKSVFYKIEPASIDLYEYGYFTNEEIYEQVQKRSPNIHTICSNSQFPSWLSKESDHFGKIVTRRKDGQPVKGRPLWLFNEGVKDYLKESDAQFRKHVQKSNNFITVGYVRKSPITESDETKMRLLNLIITRLKKRCFCERIYASFSSLSSSSIIQRDYDTKDIELKLIDCAGNTQDMLSFFATSTKSIRLCVIDYAGVSNDPDDVYNALKLYKSGKEIAIDHGNKIEVIDRYSLLRDKENKSIPKTQEQNRL